MVASQMQQCSFAMQRQAAVTLHLKLLLLVLAMTYSIKYTCTLLLQI